MLSSVRLAVRSVTSGPTAIRPDLPLVRQPIEAKGWEKWRTQIGMAYVDEPEVKIMLEEASNTGVRK